MSDTVTMPMPKALLNPPAPAFVPKRYTTPSMARTGHYWQTEPDGAVGFYKGTERLEDGCFHAEGLAAFAADPNDSITEIPIPGVTPEPAKRPVVSPAFTMPNRPLDQGGVGPLVRRGVKRTTAGATKERHRKNVLYPLSKLVETYCREHQITSVHELFRRLKAAKDLVASTRGSLSRRELRLLHSHVIDLMQAWSLANDRVTGRTNAA
jgi:hypothetical protein